MSCVLLAYIRIHGSRPGPLFVFSDGSYLTRQRFAAMVDKALGRAGFDNKQYSNSLVPRPSSLVGKNKGEEGLVELVT